MNSRDLRSQVGNAAASSTITAWWPMLLLPLLSGGCVGLTTDGTPARTVMASDRVELPVVTGGLRPDMMLVYAKINGAGPYQFLIDTGATSAMLSPELCRTLQLRRSQHSKFLLKDAGQRAEERPSTNVARLEVGGFVVENFSAAMLDTTSGNHLRKLLGPEWGGVLGMNVFADVLIELDFATHQAFVARYGTLALPKTGWVQYESDLSIPLIEIQIAGRTIKAMLDTGSGSTLDVPVVTEWPLAFPPVSGVRGIHAFGVHERKFSQLEGEVRFGPVTLRNPPIFDGLARAHVGTHALDEWKLVIDQRKKRIWLLGGEKTITWKPISSDDIRRLQENLPP